MTADGRKEPLPLAGQVIVITGASTGIGAAAATALATLGARLAIVGRSREKTAAVAARVNGEPFVCDFARFDEVRRLGAELLNRYDRIDVLANNAGLISRYREVTPDGHELTFQVNHLSPFLLTNILLPGLAAGSRVIQTSSRAQHLGRVNKDDLEASGRYRGFPVYGTTKLENVLFTRELQRRHGANGLVAVAFHPGTVRTEFNRRGGAVNLLYNTPLGLLVLLNPDQGADTLVWLATATPGRDFSPGSYYARRRPSRPAHQADDEDLAAWLWERSAELVGL